MVSSCGPIHVSVGVLIHTGIQCYTQYIMLHTTLTHAHSTHTYARTHARTHIQTHTHIQTCTTTHIFSCMQSAWGWLKLCRKNNTQHNELWFYY